jgi:alkanesulfonate monooxygenase SsuD/methylene tetrahydromethanopterin reductase-like flavin-dependent oxidoreductase (luciferase family)
MEWGIGVDASLGLSFAESADLVAEAVTLGYTSAWTPSGPPQRDAFQVCGQWHTATSGAMATGVAVIPVPVWTVQALAQQAGALGALTGGRFVLGVGTGGIYGEDYRRMHGLPDWPVVRMMREYISVVRSLLAGEVVTHEGTAVNVRGLQVTGRPIPVPIFAAALGPQMLHLAGELCDGVSLNWTAPSMRPWVREQLEQGAARSDRDPRTVRVSEYIRVCIDEDEETARKQFVRAFMGYALSRPGAAKTSGYRGHFTRMGHDAVLTRIEARRDAGAEEAELIDLFPPELLREMGYYGPAAGAAPALARLSEGLDLAVVRVVGATPGKQAAWAVMTACAPRM